MSKRLASPAFEASTSKAAREVSPIRRPDGVFPFQHKYMNRTTGPDHNPSVDETQAWDTLRSKQPMAEAERRLLAFADQRRVASTRWNEIQQKEFRQHKIEEFKQQSKWDTPKYLAVAKGVGTACQNEADGPWFHLIREAVHTYDLLWAMASYGCDGDPAKAEKLFDWTILLEFSLRQAISSMNRSIRQAWDKAHEYYTNTAYGARTSDPGPYAIAWHEKIIQHQGPRLTHLEALNHAILPLAENLFGPSSKLPGWRYSLHKAKYDAYLDNHADWRAKSIGQGPPDAGTWNVANHYTARPSGDPFDPALFIHPDLANKDLTPRSRPVTPEPSQPELAMGDLFNFSSSGSSGRGTPGR